MRFLRELLELLAGSLVGAGLVAGVQHFWPHFLSHALSARAWLGVGAGAGFLMAAAWSGHQVAQGVDYRVPGHARKHPSWRDGRPVGLLAWRARDAAMEYAFLLLGAVVVLVILWLVRTFLP